jgi:hypothetical protein
MRGIVSSFLLFRDIWLLQQTVRRLHSGPIQLVEWELSPYFLSKIQVLKVTKEV